MTVRAGLFLRAALGAALAVFVGAGAGAQIPGQDEMNVVDPPGYQPPLDHGTYIASLIAGHGSGPGDTAGVIGVAPAARILSVRVILDDQEPGFANYNDKSAYADAIGNGIRYAVGHA